MTIEQLVHTYPQYPFELVRGEGVYVYDKDGNEYLDLYGGHAVCALGHSPETVKSAIKKQIDQFFFYSNLTELDIRNRAAKALIDFADSELASVFFCNSGAEANENALKLSIQLTGRSQLVSFHGGWHGRTTLAAAVTDDKKWHAKTPGWTGDVLFLKPNDTAELEKITDSAAAVILEPIQSIGGVSSFEDQFLIALSKKTKETGTFLIFDEVQTGVGRTGVPFVNGHGLTGNSEVTADITTSAKSLGSGFPLGAMLLSKEIANQINLGDLGSTFGGGPLASAAILATLQTIVEESLMEQVTNNFQALSEGLSTSKLVTKVLGKGALIGLHLNVPGKDVVTKLRERKILSGVSGVPDIMRLLPSYLIQQEHIDRFLEALHQIEGEVL